MAILLMGLLLLSTPLSALPRIDSLNDSDPLYRQHQQMLAEYHDARRQGLGIPPVALFLYRPGRDETLFTVSSRLMIPYGTIASLNRLPHSILPEQDLLISSQPGLFVHESPEEELERTVARRLSGKEHVSLLLPRNGEIRAPVQFYHGIDYTPSERNLFLRPRFVDPLPTGVISSRYGFRWHPMTGTRMFHRGLDLAAPFGTPVVVAASGVVTGIYRDPRLGLSVRVDHQNGYTTVYAHLQEVFVREGESVSRGGRIGAVGSTGLSTGPHLHFEVLRDEEHRDPEQYIR